MSSEEDLVYKENMNESLNKELEDIKIEGYYDLWYEIDRKTVKGKTYILFENQEYGDETSHVVCILPKKFEKKTLKSGKEVDLITKDYVVCDTDDNIDTALQDEGVIESVDEGISGKMTPEEIAKKHKVSIEEINKQLEKGIEVEKEHTKDEKEAERIALDHLFEIPDYYDRLDKMEKGALKEEYGPHRGSYILEEIARYVEEGNTVGSVRIIDENEDEKYVGWTLYLTINGEEIEDLDLSNETVEYFLEDCSYPIRDGFYNYYDVEATFNKDSGIPEEDLRTMGFSRKDIIKYGQGEDVTTYFTFRIEFDDEDFDIDESLNESLTKSKYYIIDNSIGAEDSYEEFKDREEFMDSLSYNYDNAIEFGDILDDFDDIRNAFDSNRDHSEEVNGFVYAKLTDTSIDDFLGDDTDESLKENYETLSGTKVIVFVDLDEAEKEAVELAKKYNVEKDEFLKMYGGIQMLKYELEVKKVLDILMKENEK